MEKRTVRELGGEIGGALITESIQLKEEGDNTLDNLTVEMKTIILDVVMRVLARHTDKKIVNDIDFPVDPDKRSTFILDK